LVPSRTDAGLLGVVPRTRDGSPACAKPVAHRPMLRRWIGLAISRKRLEAAIAAERSPEAPTGGLARADATAPVSLARSLAEERAGGLPALAQPPRRRGCGTPDRRQSTSGKSASRCRRPAEELRASAGQAPLAPL